MKPILTVIICMCLCGGLSAGDTIAAGSGELPACLTTNDSDRVVTREDIGGRTFAAGKEREFPSGQAQVHFNPWRSLGATLFILGALMAVNLYVRKGRFAKPRGGEKRIRMLDRFAFDQKKSVVLLSVDGRRILVGIGHDRIDPIASLDDGFESDVGEEDAESAAGIVGSGTASSQSGNRNLNIQ